MTHPYDPNLAEYLDEASVRREMARVLQVCADCRRCLDMCPTFQDTFRVLDMIGNEADRMTPHVQDQLADACYDCGRCLMGCPHAPTVESPGVDVPALMIRHHAMAKAAGLVSFRRRVIDQVTTRKDVLRRSLRLLPTVARARFAPQRFSEWFLRRPRVRSMAGQGRVAMFPTCEVEYSNAGIGIDAVKVLEHNGVECSLVAPSQCCGADLLATGDIGRFTQTAIRNIRELKTAIDEGRRVVVLSARCLEIVQRRYVEFVGGPDAHQVANNTEGIASFLMSLHEDERRSLDLEFRGVRPGEVGYAPSCAARLIGEARSAEALMRLVGATVTQAEWCCGGGNCREVLAGTAQEGHPIQVVARAYGLARDP